MTITIEQYRKKIQKAKSQLIESAAAWLRTETNGLDATLIASWIEAIKASNSDELQSALQRSGFPLLRQDSLVPVQITEENPSQEGALIEQRSIVKREYQVNASLVTPTLTKLSHITTLLEQLHQLEELLTFNQSPRSLIPFAGLDLAFEMAHSINNEWRHVAQGIQTQNYYTQRSQEAHAQLQHSKQECENSFRALESPLKISSDQFRGTLVFLAESICQSYSLVKDDRRLVEFLGYRIRGYLEWHQLMNQISSELFELDGFRHPDRDSIAINMSRVQGIIASVNDEIQRPYNDLMEEYNNSAKKAHNELLLAVEKLKSLSQTLGVQAQFNARRMVPYLLSTQRHGLFSFFQAAYALGGQAFVPMISAENKEEQSAAHALQ